jgi:hypothetical protein
MTAIKMTLRNTIVKARIKRLNVIGFIGISFLPISQLIPDNWLVLQHLK